MNMQRKPASVSIRAGQVEFVKVGTDAWRWRDVYRWLLGLRWPQFAAFAAGVYITLNLLFAALYSLEQGSIAGSTGGHWFFDCFFFSVQTLAHGSFLCKGSVQHRCRFNLYQKFWNCQGRDADPGTRRRILRRKEFS